MKEDEIRIKPHKPSTGEKIFFFISGIIISVPFSIFFEQFSSYLFTSLPVSYARLLSVVFLAAFIEEFAKAYPLVYRHGETERNIFNLGVIVGFGFGILELFTYMSLLNASLTTRLPALFLHPAVTSITAYGIAKKRPIGFYFIAVFFHFLYNFTAMSELLWATAGIATVIVALLLSWFLFNKVSEKIVV